jgi:hypothetical protein
MEYYNLQNLSWNLDGNVLYGIDRYETADRFFALLCVNLLGAESSSALVGG